MYDKKQWWTTVLDSMCAWDENQIKGTAMPSQIMRAVEIPIILLAHSCFAVKKNFATLCALKPKKPFNAFHSFYHLKNLFE